MIEIYARPLDALEWICPHCSAMHTNRFIWRGSHIRCRKCKRYLRMGLGFNLEPVSRPPYNAVLALHWTGTANTLHKHVGVPAAARLVGRIDWVCPRCETPQEDKPVSWDDQSVLCHTCGAQYFIHVILYASVVGHRRSCPFDWIPLTGYKQYEKPVSSSNKSVATEKVS